MARMVTDKIRISGLAFALLMSLAFVPSGRAQSKHDEGGIGLAQVDPGHVSGNIYSNNALGFTYDFPAGWKISDKAAQQKTMETGHNANYGDSPEAQREHETTMKCMRVLLWANKPQPTNPEEGLDPAAIVFAFSPSCFPDVTFPSSSEDRQGIKNAVEFLRDAFNGSPLVSQGEQKISTFKIQNHLFLDVTVSTQMESTDTGKPEHVYASLLLTPIKDYWLVWMLMSNTDAGLRELKKLKVKFLEH